MKSPLGLRSALVGTVLELCLCISVVTAVVAQSASLPMGGASDTPSAQVAAQSSPGFESSVVLIPGPLRSFLRMAGISQKVSSDEVLPLLARQIFFLGRRDHRQTEYLLLLTRYVSQARELSALAGKDAVIRVSDCSQAQPLLRILGYAIHEQCGHSNASLATSDPERAFLTIDSGFPLSDLEQTVQGGRPFVYEYSSTSVPVLFSADTWNAVRSATKPESGDLLDRFVRDPDLALLYWSFSRLDGETAATLRVSPGLDKLLPFAALLNFYGGEICMRSGRVLVPGDSEAAWEELVGVSPETQGKFVLRLLEKDRGWLAAFFDALLRSSRAQQAHFTDARQLKELYVAFRPRDNSSDAASGVFRPAPALLLLLTRLQWDPDGDIHVPGNVQVWKGVFQQAPRVKKALKWKHDNSDQLLDMLFSLAHTSADAGPLQAFLCMSELDNRRGTAHPLSSETVRLLATRFEQYSDQYLIFSEFPDLDDSSIAEFVKDMDSINRIRNHTLRGNAMGIFQANVGLWQILARQNEIPQTSLNQSWQKVVAPFRGIASAAQLFNAGRASLRELMLAATGEPAQSQDEIVSLLAGPAQDDAEGQRVHAELADRTRAILDGQRLVSLDSLLALGNGLDQLARGETTPDKLAPLAGELREFEMPRPIFTNGERSEWAVGVYNNRHTDLEMKSDVMKLIRTAHSPAQIEEARGRLAPFLRDTLVGLNYAYYEPPGAQIMRNNPLFVRSHDFSGDTVIGFDRVWEAPQLFGAGSPAGGGAHLIGSLADLPYVLAEVEQDFIAPQHIQALIWRELVPALFTNAVVPRWWNVSRNELHAVALYQRTGEELLSISVQNQDIRTKVLAVLSDRMLPRRLALVEAALREGHPTEAFSTVTPADKFYLAAGFLQKYPGDDGSLGPMGQELRRLSYEHPAETSWSRISSDFGVPHPTLAQSYACELLNVKPFPALAGFSSRLMAESWDSTNLYWARLADEMNYPPVALNRLVPELTRSMVERIFATDTEDLPAVLRAMRETGDEFRNGKIASLSVTPSPGP
ncbi:MAG: hypothetical protein ACRD2U_02260 [Terriglobales bacterium]